MATNNVTATAKQILVGSAQGGFNLHEENLKSILLSDDVRDKPVVVISVAGAFRKGKSFLLDMMLRYLTASNKSEWIKDKNLKDWTSVTGVYRKFKSILSDKLSNHLPASNKSDSTNDENSKGSGFPWQSGYRRHTTGILMWGQPFPVTLPTGEEAVIILMDTQGTFDNQSTVQESSTVFALSTLLSSLQIFNLMGNLQNDDLEHLQLFTEFGRMALDDSNAKPFQKLLFLVRDWQFIHQLPLGTRGGDQLVAEWFQNHSGKEELAMVREHIKDCFTEISGFLLPHPGQKVTSNPKFNGSSEDMDPAFVTGLNELIPKILAPENLTVKTIAGNPLTGSDLLNFIDTYVNLFKGDKLPEPKSIFQATAETNNMVAVQEALFQYETDMECLHLEDQPSLEQDKLSMLHKDAAAKAEKAFNDRKKMGNWEMSQHYLKQLVQQMEKWFRLAEQANNNKREKETLDAEMHNDGLVITCQKVYIKEMEQVVVEDGHVPQKDMDSAHDGAKQKAMAQFDIEKREFCGIDVDRRFKLAQNIDAEHMQMVFHNQVKKDVKNRKAAQANMKAVDQAKQCYQSMMNTMTSDGTFSDEELRHRHQQALQSASEMFESLKEGEEIITVGYRENMKNDIGRELDTYMRANQNKVKVNQLKARVETLEAQLQQERAKTQGRKPTATPKKLESKCAVM